jgi:hypothetical protein
MIHTVYLEDSMDEILRKGRNGTGGMREAGWSSMSLKIRSGVRGGRSINRLAMTNARLTVVFPVGRNQQRNSRRTVTRPNKTSPFEHALPTPM